MLCAKCHKNEATVHFTTVVADVKVEKVDLCKECAAGFMGLGDINPENLKAMSVVGKRCEFCGKDAVSGQTNPKGGGTYWCFDCGAEFARIRTELLMAERPELFQQAKDPGWLAGIFTRQEVQDWLAEVNQKAVKILKGRRSRDPNGR